MAEDWTAVHRNRRDMTVAAAKTWMCVLVLFFLILSISDQLLVLLLFFQSSTQNTEYTQQHSFQGLRRDARER